MVTLRDFIKIAPDLIEPWCCRVVIEYNDEYYGRDQKVLLNKLDKTSELDPYLDYEIIDFDQSFDYGELDEQFVVLREVAENERFKEN